MSSAREGSRSPFEPRPFAAPKRAGKSPDADESRDLFAAYLDSREIASNSGGLTIFSESSTVSVPVQRKLPSGLSEEESEREAQHVMVEASCCIVDKATASNPSRAIDPANAPHLPTGETVQRQSMLVLIGKKKDRQELKANTEEEEENLKLEAVKLSKADLSKLGEGDTLYLSGAHGNESSFGPYESGAKLVDALYAKGLRKCASVWLTGCNTGGGFSRAFYAAAGDKGIVIKDYVTAPKTLGRTRDGGRMTAETPEGAEVGKLKSEVKKKKKAKKTAPLPVLFDLEIDGLKEKIDKIEKQPGYWKEIENPVQLAEELKEQYDSLDRAYKAYSSEDPPEGSINYELYKSQFDSLKKAFDPRLDKSLKVWTVHASKEVQKAFLAVRNREPLPRKIWDLSGLV